MAKPKFPYGVDAPRMNSDILYQSLILLEQGGKPLHDEIILYGEGSNGKTTLILALEKRYEGTFVKTERLGDRKYMFTNASDHSLVLIETNEKPEGQNVVTFLERFIDTMWEFDISQNLRDTLNLHMPSRRKVELGMTRP